MKKIQTYFTDKKILLIAMVLIILLILSPLLTGTSFAQVDQVRQGISATGDSPPGVTVDGIVSSVINILSFIIGVISVIMIIIGGLKYITSTGDSSKVESAKNTIIYAVIGLVIVALAQLIVIFVLDRTVGSSNSGDSSVIPSLVAKQDFDQIN